MSYEPSRLRALRDDRNWSRRRVVIALSGAGCEVSEETLRRWEAGIASPRADDLAALAAVLEVDPEYFFANNGDES